MRKFLFAAAMGLSALAAIPANAQAYQGTPPPPEGYYDDGYAGPDEWAPAEGGYDGPQTEVYAQVDVDTGYSDHPYPDPGYTSGPRRYRPGDYYEGGGTALNRDPRRSAPRYRERRCTGTTGAILGGIAGALIGGDVGNGRGRYGRRSNGTGTVIGAGVGAVIGSEIDRSSCEDNRRYR